MLSNEKVHELEQFAMQIRIETLKALGTLGFGHVGGSMSMVELLATLYGDVMHVDPQNPESPDRDYFVLSKGHSGPALYATLAIKGYFPVEELATLNKPGTNLPSHCDRNRTKGVDMSTGSLGQGMSTAIGLAMATKLDKKPNYTYLVIGDGECDEGQIWEGALFAPQHKLNQLIVFIDKNNQQLDGYTDDILSLGDMRQKMEDFNWFSQEIDGHNIQAIAEAVAKAKAQTEQPSMIILNTKKGFGCNFAEGVLYNHHMTFTAAQVESAIGDIECKLAAH